MDRRTNSADLILLDRNPLADVRNADHPVGVIIRGRWLSSSEISRRLEAIRNNPVNYRHASEAH